MIDPRVFRQVMGQFATGVTIVTTRDAAGHPRGLTVNSFSSVSLDPPLVLFCLVRSSANLEAFRAAEGFAVSILRREHRPLSDRFAKGGEDKFSEGRWRPGRYGAPVLEDALATIECRRWATYEGGDHLIFVGQVEDLTPGEGDPLCFFRGRYTDISPPPAQ